MQVFLRITVTLIGVMGFSLAHAQSINGAMLGNTCSGCHGTNGAAINAIIPPLAGKDKAQFIQTMIAYREGERRGTIMNRVARAYSNEEIEAMAVFFASFPKNFAE